MKSLTHHPLSPALLAISVVVTGFLLLAPTPAQPPHPASGPGASGHLFAAQTCTSCHNLPPGGIPDSLRFLEGRMQLSQAAWADSAHLAARCGSCHAAPDPGQLPRSRWPEAISYMGQVQYYVQAVPAHENYRGWAQAHSKENLDILHYFLAFSKDAEKLPPDPAISGIRFTPATIGADISPDMPPRIANVNVVDLDQNGAPDVLVCNFNGTLVTWIHREGTTWKERPLARSPYAGHTEVADIDKDGNLDIIVSVLGTDVPSDKRGGAVALIMGQGDMQFGGKVILTDVGRVADTRPGDFDGDGDVDLVVAIFGWLKEGEIGWLEQQDSLSFVYHRVVKETGGANVIPTDLNGDGALDFVALLTQEHEEVTAFLNDGHGTFAPHVLYKAAFPTFGSSGIELVDLDQDGDLDVLYTNGDAVDLASPMVRPYHGVQWLE
ncbi:MAG TPA: VCBS repeat-containing protein, partial [Rhodothermales bacterium]|nr:VCBS repeat-containing protein [Rhodothermales bacterium]